jgi:hypothetical protein
MLSPKNSFSMSTSVTAILQVAQNRFFTEQNCIIRNDMPERTYKGFYSCTAFKWLTLYKPELPFRVWDHFNTAYCSPFCCGLTLWGLNIFSALWSSGQSFWLQIQRSRVRFPALPDFLRSSGSGTGSSLVRTTDELLEGNVAAQV